MVIFAEVTYTVVFVCGVMVSVFDIRTGFIRCMILKWLVVDAGTT